MAKNKEPKKKKTPSTGYFKKDKQIQEELPGNKLFTDGILALGQNRYSRTYRVPSTYVLSPDDLETDSMYLITRDFEGNKYLTITITFNGKVSELPREFEYIEQAVGLRPLSVEERYAALCRMYHFGERAKTSLIQKKRNSLQWKNGVPSRHVTFKEDVFISPSYVGRTFAVQRVNKNSTLYAYLEKLPCEKMDSYMVVPVNDGSEETFYIAGSFITIWTDTEEKLEKLTEELKRQCGKEEERLIVTRKLIKNTIETSLPFGINKSQHTFSYNYENINDFVKAVERR